MNIEEARKHIGKEVVLDESTEPYKGPLKETHDFGLNVYGIIEDVNHDYVKVKLKVGNRINIMPHHLKLKQPNYKIRVTPETSAEVQELFFELGIGWADNSNLPKYLNFRFLCTENGLIKATNDYGMFIDNPAKGITLPELRKLVLDSRNDPKDATHEDNYGRFWLMVGDAQYLWNLDSKKWKETQPMNLKFKELKKLENISIEVIATDSEYQFETEIERHEVEPSNKKVKGFFDDWKTKEMTWQDAYIAMANGQQVQVWIADGDRWETINHHDNWSIAELAQEKLRLEPPSITLEARAYTKEELLNIVEGME